MAVELTYVSGETISGITCGQRKDGSRCVLWADNTFEWFKSDEFAATFGV